MAEESDEIGVRIVMGRPVASSEASGDKSTILSFPPETTLRLVLQRNLQNHAIKEKDRGGYGMYTLFGKDSMELDLGDRLKDLKSIHGVPILFCYEGGSGSNSTCSVSNVPLEKEITIVKEGWLFKKGSSANSKFRKRFFRLASTNIITYHKSEKKGSIQGKIDLTQPFRVFNDMSIDVTLKFETRTFWIRASSEGIANSWFNLFHSIQQKLHMIIQMDSPTTDEPLKADSRKDNTALSEENKSSKDVTVYKEGFLRKRGQVNKNWKRRWCVVLQDRLLYYRLKKDKKPAGEIIFDEKTIIQPEQRATREFDNENSRRFSLRFTDETKSFAVIQAGRRYIFNYSEGTCSGWVNVLEERITELFPSSLCEISVKTGSVKIREFEKRSWTTRFVIISSCSVSVYKTEEDRKPIFAVNLDEIRVNYGFQFTGEENSLEISSSSGKSLFLMKFTNETEFADWITSFEVVTGRGVMFETGISTYSEDPEAILDELNIHEVVARALDCNVFEVSLTCNNLVDMDYFSKSDPLAYLYEKDSAGSYHLLSKSEVVMNSLDPNFVHKFIIHASWRGDDSARLFLLKLYDIDDFQDLNSIGNQDFLGEIEFSLDDLVNSPLGKMVSPISSEPIAKKFILGNIGNKLRKQKGYSTICYEDCHFDNKIISMDIEIRSEGLHKPFIQINRMREDGIAIPVLRSSAKSKDFEWQGLVASFQTVCLGSDEWPLEFLLLEWKKKGHHSVVAKQRTNLREIEANDGYIKLLGEKQVVMKLNFDVLYTPTFLHYFDRGLRIYNTIVVDFGLDGNLHPSNPESNHHLSKGTSNTEENVYTKAISAVLGALRGFSADDTYAIFGVGGNVEGTTDGSKIAEEKTGFFPLTGYLDAPCVVGMEELLGNYRYAAKDSHLNHSDTFELSPVLEHIKRTMLFPEPADYNQYHVITVFCSGQIGDFAEATKSIIELSHCACSILFVGLTPRPREGGCFVPSPLEGQIPGTFSEEQEEQYFKPCILLDSDSARLHVGGTFATRDVVQFLYYDRYASYDIGLTRKIFEEIPYQVVEYVHMKMEEIEDS